MPDLSLTVNGDPLALPAGSTIADVVAEIVGPGDGRGIAVAVDREVVPKSAWSPPWPGPGHASRS